MQDAINEIASIISLYPSIRLFSVKPNGEISIDYENEVEDKTVNRTFSNAIVMLEWCEKNLDETPF